MTERETPQQGGLSRRDMLKRSAVVGGALVWTTPAVQSLMPAAHAGTEAPSGWSNFTFVFTYDGTKYQAKYENGGGVPDGWENSPGGRNCVEGSGYNDSDRDKVNGGGFFSGPSFQDDKAVFTLRSDKDVDKLTELKGGTFEAGSCLVSDVKGDLDTGTIELAIDR